MSDYVTLLDVPVLRASLSVQRQTRSGATRPFSAELGLHPNEHGDQINALRAAAQTAIQAINGAWDSKAECQSAITAPFDLDDSEWNLPFVDRY